MSMMAGSSVSGLRKRRGAASESTSTARAPSQSESMRPQDERESKRPHLSSSEINKQQPARDHPSGPRSGHAESSHGRTEEAFLASSHVQPHARPSKITFASVTSLLQGDGTASSYPSQPWLFQPPPPPPPPPALPSISAPDQSLKLRQPPRKPKAPLKLLLSDWIDHQGVIAAFASIGVKTLYPWQAAAIECAELGENLIYCAPTSGGKSLVAEVLLIRQILRRLAHHGKAVRKAFGKIIMPEPIRALLVLPFVSIVSEKTRHLESILKPLGLVVRGYAGGLSDQYGSPLSSKDECLAICTIEKANAAINRLVKEGRVNELACIVVDEAHMVGDPQRGLPLELSLTKIVHASKRFRANLEQAGNGGGESLPHPPQIVCMSATMGGLESMGNWLDAHVFKTNYRPVVLSEHAIFNRKIFVKRETMFQPMQVAEGNICPLVEQGSLPVYDGEDDIVLEGLSDGMAMLVAEVVAVGHSCLVFCAGRSACQTSASLLASTLSKLTAWLASKHLASPPHLSEEESERIRLRRRSLVMDLSNASGGRTNELLASMFLEGIAYHHAGLTSQERLIVERGFREGSLLALCCTSTLAAGINLPARRVILRTLWQGAGPVSRSTYLQMIGRAGRAGQSAIGEAFIIGKGQPPETVVNGPGGEVKVVKRGGGDWEDICKLVNEPMPILKSRLLQSSSIKSTADVATSRDDRGDKMEADQLGQTTKVVTRSSTAPSNSGVSHRSASAGSNRPHLDKSCGGTGQMEVSSASLISDSESKEELAFQQLMLEGVANASATTDYAIRDLLSSTLLSHQIGHQLLERAAKRALSKLRAMGLIIPREGLVPSHQLSTSAHSEMLRYWETTPMGTAVYASSLPIRQGMDLYQRLDRARQTVILSTPLHPILVSLMDQPLEISGWGTWEQLYRTLSDGAKALCELEGVTMGYITRMRSGGKGDKEISRKHGRIAGAWLLHLSFDREAHEVEEAWGLPKTLTEKGFPSGEIQRLQKELANCAGMAAVMCSSSGWWHLETIMSNLAQQAAAGVRAELLPLMQVPMMTGARARALFAAGVLSPQDLALSDEEAVKQAVEASIPKMLSKPTVNPLNPNANQSKTPHSRYTPHNRYAKTDPAYLTRAARSLIQSAREHVVDEAQRAALTVCLQGKFGPAIPPSVEDKLEEETAAIADELLLSLLPPSSLSLMNNLSSSPSSIPQPPLNMAQMRGRAKVTDLSSSTDPQAVKDVLRDLLEQNIVSIGVSRRSITSCELSASILGDASYVARARGAPEIQSGPSLLSSPSSRLPLIPEAAMWSIEEEGRDEIGLSDTNQALDDQSEGVAIAWRHNECFFFHLSSAEEGKGGQHKDFLEQFWTAIATVLDHPHTSKIIFGLRQSLSSLFSLHAQFLMSSGSRMKISGPILDPQLLYWCINPWSDEGNLDLQHLLHTILPQYAMQVQAASNQSVMQSSRRALAAFALARPLLAMLVTQSPQASKAQASPLSIYEKVEVALSISLARSAAGRRHVDKCDLAPYEKWLQGRISEIDDCVSLIFGGLSGAKIDLSQAPQMQWLCRHAGLELSHQPIHPYEIWSMDPLFDKCSMQPGSHLVWLPINGLREEDHVRARLVSSLIEERQGLSSLLEHTQSICLRGELDMVPCLNCVGSFVTLGQDADFIFHTNLRTPHSQTFLANLQHTQTLEQRLAHEESSLDAWNGSQVLFAMPYSNGRGEGLFQGVLLRVTPSKGGSQLGSSFTCSISVLDSEDASTFRRVEVPSSCAWLLLEDACGANALSSSISEYITTRSYPPTYPSLIPVKLQSSPLSYIPGNIITVRFPSLYLCALAFHSQDPSLLLSLDKSHSGGDQDPWTYLTEIWLQRSPDCKILRVLSSNGRASTSSWPLPPRSEFTSDQVPSLPRANLRDLTRAMVEAIAHGDGPKRLALRLSAVVNFDSRGDVSILSRSDIKCPWSFSRDDAISLMSSFLAAFPRVADHQAGLVSSHLLGKFSLSLLGRQLCSKMFLSKNSALPSIQARMARQIQSVQVKTFANEVIRAATTSALLAFYPDISLLWCQTGVLAFDTMTTEPLKIFSNIKDTVSREAVLKYLGLSPPYQLPQWQVFASLLPQAC